MPHVLENGIRKTASKVMESTYDKYMRGANPIGYFVEKILVNDVNAKTKKLDMYDAYKKFCLENGLALESDQSFSRKMTKYFGFVSKRIRDKGDYVYYWACVRQKTPLEIEEQRRLEDIGEYSPETKEKMK